MHLIVFVLVYEIYMLVRIINDPCLCIKLQCRIMIKHLMYSWSSHASRILLNPYIIYIWVDMQNVCIKGGPYHILLWRCWLWLFNKWFIIYMLMLGLWNLLLITFHHIYVNTYACLALYIYFMIKQYVNARIMKFIPNEIRIVFSRFLALLGSW